MGFVGRGGDVQAVGRQEDRGALSERHLRSRRDVLTVDCAELMKDEEEGEEGKESERAARMCGGSAGHARWVSTMPDGCVRMTNSTHAHCDHDQQGHSDDDAAHGNADDCA